MEGLRRDAKARPVQSQSKPSAAKSQPKPVRMDDREREIWGKLKGQAVGPRSNVWNPIRKSPKQKAAATEGDSESEHSADESEPDVERHVASVQQAVTEASVGTPAKPAEDKSPAMRPSDQVAVEAPLKAASPPHTASVAPHKADAQRLKRENVSGHKTRAEELARAVKDLERQLREMKSALKDSHSKLETALADATKAKEENSKLKAELASLKLGLKAPSAAPKVPSLGLQTASLSSKALSARESSKGSASTASPTPAVHSARERPTKGVKVSMSPRRKQLNLSPRRSPRRGEKTGALPAKDKAKSAASPAKSGSVANSGALEPPAPTAPASEQALQTAKSPSPCKSKTDTAVTSRLHSPTAASLGRLSATQRRRS